MMTNMKDFNRGKKVEYNLTDVYVTISDSSIYWTLPFKVTDTDTPNIIKTTNGEIGISTFTQDYEKQLNTLTNITSYTGKSSLWINSEKVLDLDINARIFPNSTAVLEMTET